MSSLILMHSCSLRSSQPCFLRTHGVDLLCGDLLELGVPWRLTPDGTSTPTRARTVLSWDVRISEVGARQQAEPQRLPHHADEEAAAAEPVLPLERCLGGGRHSEASVLGGAWETLEGCSAALFWGPAGRRARA